MTGWTEDLRTKVNGYYDELAVLRHQCESDDDGYFISMKKYYGDVIHDMYRDELALSMLLDASMVAAEYVGESLRPTPPILKGLCGSWQLALAGITESVIECPLDENDKKQWPLEALPGISGFIPSGPMIGISPIRQDEDLFSDQNSTQIGSIAESVCSAIGELARIGNHIGDDAIDQEFVEKNPDPLVRDAILSAAHNLSPMVKGRVDEMTLYDCRHESSRRSTLNRGSRKVLKQALNTPKKNSKTGSFLGVVRAVDLDARRFTIRSPVEHRAIRCAFSEFDWQQARDMIGAFVSVSGSYEVFEDFDTPRLVHVDSFTIQRTAAVQCQLEF